MSGGQHTQRVQHVILKEESKGVKEEEQREEGEGRGEERERER